MRGGFIISNDRGLFERSAGALVALGASISSEPEGGQVVQFRDPAGRLFTMFEVVPVGTEWEVIEGPFVAASGVESPNMQLVHASSFECRWPDLVVKLANVIARTGEAPTWVLDGDGVIWDAEAIDPQRIRL